MNGHLLQRSHPIVAKQPLGDATRFGRRLGLDLNEENGVDELGRFIGGKQGDASAHGRAGAQGCWEPDFVQAVIEGHLDARANVNCQPEKVRQQRESQETMSDGAAEGSFASGAHGVEMNPLAILGGVGKFLDAILRDDKPIGRGKFAPFAGFQRIQILNLKGWHRSFS